MQEIYNDPPRDQGPEELKETEEKVRRVRKELSVRSRLWLLRSGILTP